MGNYDSLLDRVKQVVQNFKALKVPRWDMNLGSLVSEATTLSTLPTTHFLQFCLFNRYSWQFLICRYCRWLDSNGKPLVWEATALPSEPQPLRSTLPIFSLSFSTYFVSLCFFFPSLHLFLLFFCIIYSKHGCIICGFLQHKTLTTFWEEIALLRPNLLRSTFNLHLRFDIICSHESQMILQSKKRYYILLSIILFSASIYFCLSLSLCLDH